LVVQGGVSHCLEAKALAAKRKMRERASEEEPVTRIADQPADAAASRDLRLVLDEEVNRLPEKYRTPILLCYFEGKTYEEAAEQLGCPRGTVSIRLMRARELLRPRLVRRGVTLSSGTLAAALAQDATSAPVPLTLVGRTVKAGLLYAAGRVLATGDISCRVVALTEGVLQTMFVTKLKMAAVVLLAVAVAGTGAGVATFRGLAGEQPGLPVNEALTPAPDEEQKPPAKPSRDQRERELETRRQLEQLEKKTKHLQAAISRAEEGLVNSQRQFREWEQSGAVELIDARVRLMEKEERVKELEEERRLVRQKREAIQGILEDLRSENINREQNIKLAEWELEKQKAKGANQFELLRKEADRDEMKARLINDRERLARQEGRLKEYDQKNAELNRELAPARREAITADENLRRLQRRQAMQRQKVLRQVEADNERLQRLREELHELTERLQGEALRSDSEKQRPAELERKMDQLLREVTELRREIRRQPANKSDQDQQPRRPDKP
jgi:hypothetical protein